MTILAIDPGPKQSAWVLYRHGDKSILDCGICENIDAVALFADIRGKYRNYGINVKLVIEMIASYGMPVGKEVFETCVWIGKFLQAWSGDAHRITRQQVKLVCCGSVRAKDANIRQAMIDYFGCKPKGVRKDIWAALAVAVAYASGRAELYEA